MLHPLPKTTKMLWTLHARIEEIIETNSVHRHFNPEYWNDFQHYLFGFHDTTFECIAESFEVETYEESMRQLMTRACNQMVSRA